MRLVRRLKRHTVPVLPVFRVEPDVFNPFKLLHFLVELDPFFFYITWKFIVPVKTSLPQLLQTYFGSDDKCCCESDGVIEAGNLTEKYFLGHLYSIVY